ncbi:MAG: c-type cytochrome biogenesis protein CcmI [Pseudomonadales bacterium]|nr:c-type cytochrome biogenesis protein CcmI [Pseudomonadales bacterium]
MITDFWIYATLLGLIAACFVLLPVIRRRKNLTEADRREINIAIFRERVDELEQSLAAGEIDQVQFEQLKREQEKNLLIEAGDPDASAEPPVTAGVRPALVLGLLLPVFGWFAYSESGFSWGAITDVQLADEMSANAPHDASSMAASVEKLAARLRNQPDNDDGWFLLSQSYMRLGRYDNAVISFDHLRKRYPMDPNIASWYAEAVFMADGRQMTERVDKAIAMTLKLNPHDVSMLEIRAMDAFQKGDQKAALQWFRKALQTGLEGDRAELLRKAVARLEEDLGLKPGEGLPGEAEAMGAASMAASAQGETATATGRVLTVTVEKADGLEAGASDKVFVYARALNGPKMPLAVQQFPVGALPKTVRLDETMAMMPGMGLANFDQVEVVARISSSGIANASPDDFEAKSAPVNLTTEPTAVSLKIEKRIRDQ